MSGLGSKCIATIIVFQSLFEIRFGIGIKFCLHCIFHIIS